MSHDVLIKNSTYNNINIIKAGFYSSLVKRSGDKVFSLEYKGLKVRPRVEVFVRDKNGNILLGEHRNQPGLFIPPGGGIDDQSLEEAAKREVQEETGKNIRNAMPLNIDPFLFPYGDGKGSLTSWVLADLAGGRRSSAYGADNDIIPNLKFFKPEEALHLLGKNHPSAKGDKHLQKIHELRKNILKRIINEEFK